MMWKRIPTHSNYAARIQRLRQETKDTRGEESLKTPKPIKEQTNFTREKKTRK